MFHILRRIERLLIELQGEVGELHRVALHGPPRSPMPRREFNIEMQIANSMRTLHEQTQLDPWKLTEIEQSLRQLLGSKGSPASAASGRPTPTRGSNARATTRSKRGTRKG